MSHCWSQWAQTGPPAYIPLPCQDIYQSRTKKVPSWVKKNWSNVLKKIKVCFIISKTDQSFLQAKRWTHRPSSGVAVNPPSNDISNGRL